MFTYAELRRLLIDHNCIPSVDLEDLTLQQYVALMQDAHQKLGESGKAFLANCFPEYEDGCSHYVFQFTRWEQLEETYAEYARTGIVE